MISVDNGICQIEGNGLTLLTELAAVVSSLKSSGLPEDLILKTAATGLVYSDQVKEESLKNRKDLYEKVMKEIERRRNAQADESAANPDEG